MQLGRYEVGDELGRGGMARVHRARDPAGAEVALKLIDLRSAQLDPELATRFLTEVQAASRLEHPAIVPALDSGNDQGYAYLAMPLLAGGSLSDRLREGPLPARRVAEIGLRLADALATAHEQGVLHRDLKPANVLLDAEGAVYLADFGLARILDTTRMTQSGAVLGTANYMAPEQALGEAGRVGRATDVYGLGATLHALLSGRPPFPGADLFTVLRAVVEEPPPALPPEVDAELAALVSRCLAKSPAARPELARLRADLEAWLERDLHGLPARGGWVSRALAGVGVAAAVGLLLAWAAPRGSGSPAGAALPAPSSSEQDVGPAREDLADLLARVPDVQKQRGAAGALALLQEAAARVGPATPDDVARDYHLARGSLEAALGDHAAAHASLDAGLERLPEDPRLLVEQAKLVYGWRTQTRSLPLTRPPRLTPAEAEEVDGYLERLFAVRPDDRAGRLLAAYVQLSRGDDPAARRALDRYLELPEAEFDSLSTPEDDRAVARLQRGRLQADIQDAISDFDRAARRPSFRSLAVQEAVQRCERDGFAAEAEVRLTPLVEASPTPQLRAWRGRLRLAQGDCPRALEDFHAARAAGDPEAAGWIARAERRRDLIRELGRQFAERAYERVVERLAGLDPADEDGWTRFFRGVALLEWGHRTSDEARIAQAVVELQAAARRRSRDSQVRGQAGRALRRAGQLHEALSEFVLAAKLAPGEPEPIYEVSLTLLNLGADDLAAEGFAHLLESQPPAEIAVRARMQLLWALNRSGQADQVLARAAGGGSQEELAHQVLALFELGQDAQAAQLLAGLDLRSERVVEVTWLAELLGVALALGDARAVRRLLGLQGLNLSTSPRLRSHMAQAASWLATRAGDHAEAARRARADLERDPDFSALSLRAIAAAAQQGELDWARGEARHLAELWRFEPFDPAERRATRVWDDLLLHDVGQAAALVPGHLTWVRIRASRGVRHDAAEAELALTDLIDAGLEAPDLRLQRGWLRSWAGHDREAVRDLEAACARGERRDLARLELGKHHRRQGRSEAGGRVLRELLAALGPEDPLYRETLFELWRAEGDPPWR